jgi:hypothetical protein
MKVYKLDVRYTVPCMLTLVTAAVAICAQNTDTTAQTYETQQ